MACSAIAWVTGCAFGQAGQLAGDRRNANLPVFSRCRLETDKVTFNVKSDLAVREVRLGVCRRMKSSPPLSRASRLASRRFIPQCSCGSRTDRQWSTGVSPAPPWRSPRRRPGRHAARGRRGVFRAVLEPRTHRSLRQVESDSFAAFPAIQLPCPAFPSPDRVEQSIRGGGPGDTTRGLPSGLSAPAFLDNLRAAAVPPRRISSAQPSFPLGRTGGLEE
jgi:hypothetical protein